MELHGLDCVDLVVSYTIYLSPKSANSLQELPPTPPASNRYGLTKLNAKNKGVMRKGFVEKK